MSLFPVAITHLHQMFSQLIYGLFLDGETHKNATPSSAMIPVMNQGYIPSVSNIFKKFQESSFSLGEFETKNRLGYWLFRFSADHMPQMNLRCFVFCKVSNRITFTLQTIKQILGIYA